MNQPSSRDPLLNIGSPYSIGTSFAIDTIENMYLDRHKVKPNVIAINIITLLRNRLGQRKDALKSLLFTELKNEILILVEDIGAILSASNVNNATLLLYAIDYRKSIPKEVSRPYVGARESQQTYVEYFLRRFRELFTNSHSTLNEVDINFEIYQGHGLPHVFLANTIKKLSRIQSCLMLSHCPLDYHVSPKIREFLIVESHTGKLRTYKELGKKIFKRDHIPFTPQTHALLGDKDFIKSPLPIGDKKKIYGMSVDNHWEIKTDLIIRKDINSLKLNSPINFN